MSRAMPHADSFNVIHIWNTMMLLNTHGWVQSETRKQTTPWIVPCLLKICKQQVLSDFLKYIPNNGHGNGLRAVCDIPDASERKPEKWCPCKNMRAIWLWILVTENKTSEKHCQRALFVEIQLKQYKHPLCHFKPSLDSILPMVTHLHPRTYEHHTSTLADFTRWITARMAQAVPPSATAIEMIEYNNVFNGDAAGSLEKWRAPTDDSRRKCSTAHTQDSISFH